MVRDPAALARLARAAERFGYDGVWANDHLVTPRFLRGAAEGTPTFYEPLVTLAHVAAVTTRIGIGTAVSRCHCATRRCSRSRPRRSTRSRAGDSCLASASARSR